MSWYRKSFAVPEEWQGEKAIYLKIKGAQRSARVFLNGAEIAFHPLAYTEFVVRLDTATATVASPSSPDATASLLRYGAGRKNILAVFVDATFSSFDGMGWWYEGQLLTTLPHPASCRGHCWITPPPSFYNPPAIPSMR